MRVAAVLTSKSFQSARGKKNLLFALQFIHVCRTPDFFDDCFSLPGWFGRARKHLQNHDD
jgi:hypothetical protein